MSAELAAPFQEPLSIPLDLRNIPQWVGYRTEPRNNGKVNKLPVNPHTGNDAKVNDPATWGTFDQARAAMESSAQLAGVGFVLAPGGGIVGIDLDDVRDPVTGALDRFAEKVIRRFGSYAEVSPSGKGVHILGRGALPAENTRRKGIEMYDSVHYLTVTGKQIDQTPAALAACQQAIDDVYAWIAKDAPIVEKAESEDPLFKALWNGDTSAYDGDDSAADLALCNKLASRCGWDPKQMDRIFRWSGLMRDKWDEKHYSTGETHGEHTIAKALEPADQPSRASSPQSLNRPFTDLGNAKRLVQRHGEKIRCCPTWRKWLVWDGIRWKVDETGDVIRMAKETAEAIYAQARASGIEDVLKSAKACQSAGRLKNMVEVASTEPGIPVLADELDRDAYLLNCLNGTLDLHTGELKPHRREDLLTKLCPIPYDPQAKCPIFEKFLARIMADDEQLIEYIRRCFGYALTGDVTEKAAFVLVGNGDNGKTTLVEAMRYVLGDYAGQIPIESLLKKQSEGISNDIAQLRGARFVSASEAEEGRQFAEGKLKHITGMGTLQVRFMYAEFFHFSPTFKIFMDTNHKPAVHGDDNAIWNRLRIIPFGVSIPPEEKDKHLLEKLKSEGPGILAWLVRGCLEWQKRGGLGEPVAVTAATGAHREEMDTIKHFLDEACELDAGLEATVADLYGSYKEWCVHNDESPKSRKAFGTRLGELGLTPGKLGGQRSWRGIRLRPEEQAKAA